MLWRWFRMFQLQHNKMPFIVRLDEILSKHHCGCNKRGGPLQQSYPKQVVYLEGLLEGSASCGEVVGRAVDSPHVFQGSTQIWVASSVVQCNHICRIHLQVDQKRSGQVKRYTSAVHKNARTQVRHISTYSPCSFQN